MSDVAQQVVTEALSWVGTPYRHQASRKGAGADCLGLLLGLWRAVHGAEPEPVPAYSPDWSEPQGREDLLHAAQRHLIAKPIDATAAGDVLLFRMRRGAVAKHLGIISSVQPSSQFIHAYTGHGVVESPLSSPWRRRIAARFVVSKG